MKNDDKKFGPGANTSFFSDKDYLEFERFAQEKHEFLDGSVFAMAGESPDHSTICFNLYGIIYNQLRGKNCRGFSPNMKVATNESVLFSYPDLAIIAENQAFMMKKAMFDKSDGYF